MLSPQVVKLARDRIQIDIKEQNARLEKRIALTTNDASAKGMLGSSRFSLLKAEQCADAVKERGQIAWRDLHRAVTTAGMSYYEGIEAELAAIVEEFLPQALEDIRHHLLPPGAMGMDKEAMRNHFNKVLNDARDVALQTAHNEIGLFAHNLMARAAQAGTSNATTVHVYAPVGSIQTGAGSVANVNMSLDEGSKAKLVEALNSLLQAIPRSPELTAQTGAQLRELVEETVVEVKKQQPNNLKLRTTLSGIASTIQTVGAFKDVFEVVKSAVEAVGGVIGL
jgi:hypothetical protein